VSSIERPDPAASWRRYTPRQAARAAVRFDREAKAAIAAHKAQQLAGCTERAIARALLRVEGLGIVLLTGVVTGKSGARQATQEELACCKDSVKDGWKTLKRYAVDRVTVLS